MKKSVLSSNIKKDKESVDKTKKSQRNIPRETLISFRRSMFSEKLIGEPEELIPFSWRYPIKIASGKKISKVLKTMASAEAERELRVPVISKDE